MSNTTNDVEKQRLAVNVHRVFDPGVLQLSPLAKELHKDVLARFLKLHQLGHFGLITEAEEHRNWLAYGCDTGSFISVYKTMREEPLVLETTFSRLKYATDVAFIHERSVSDEEWLLRWTVDLNRFAVNWI